VSLFTPPLEKVATSEYVKGEETAKNLYIKSLL